MMMMMMMFIWKDTKKKKQQPKTYMHECKAELFRERLLQLPEEKPRARLLEMELQRVVALEADAKADVVEVAAAVVPPLLLQLSSVNEAPSRAHKRNLEQVRRALQCDDVALMAQAADRCAGVRRGRCSRAAPPRPRQRR